MPKSTEAAEIVTEVYHHTKTSFFTHIQIATSKQSIFLNNTHCEEITHLFGTLNNAVYKAYKTVFWNALL
jgi:hypothetical protein